MFAVPITSHSADLAKVQSLYIEAFPANERSPFHLLLDDRTHCSEIFAFYESETFCGFMSLLTLNDISHIIYFAIDQSLRRKGYGAEALAVLRQLKPHHRLLADIESPVATAENYAQRGKRKQFYLKNGYVSSEVSYAWRDETYEILVNGGDLSDREFWNFWDSVSKINREFAKF